MGQKANEIASPAVQSMDWGELRDGVGVYVRLLRNELTTRIMDAYEPFGLRMGTLSTMALIQANPDCSQSEIAREVAMDDSAMVAIIDDLEKQGLALRTRSRRDRRRNSLSLTAEGERVLREMVNASKDVEAPVRSVLSAQELATLRDLLRRSYGALMQTPAGK